MFLLAVVRWVMGGRDVVLSCIGIRRYDHHKRYYDYGRVFLLYLRLSGIVVVVVTAQGYLLQYYIHIKIHNI